MEVIAKCTFIRESITMKRGEKVTLPADTARDLITAGLVREAPEAKKATEVKADDKPSAKTKKAEG